MYPFVGESSSGAPGKGCRAGVALIAEGLQLRNRSGWGIIPGVSCLTVMMVMPDAEARGLSLKNDNDLGQADEFVTVNEENPVIQSTKTDGLFRILLGWSYLRIS
jgi:hypothetical protein